MSPRTVKKRVLVLGPVATERAEKEVEKFINSRSRLKDKANLLAQEWAASEKRYFEKRREANSKPGWIITEGRSNASRAPWRRW